MRIGKALVPAVFLDRDGVLNRAIVRNGKPYAPRCLDEFEIFPEAVKLTQVLKNAGFLLIVVTNQPDVGNRMTAQTLVEKMHDRLFKLLTLDDIKVCYHSQLENCSCRKPKPGLIMEAAELWEVDLKKSFMIGDRVSDVMAGAAAGCRTVFIDYRYSETQHVTPPNLIVNSFEEAVTSIVTWQVARQDGQAGR